MRIARVLASVALAATFATACTSPDVAPPSSEVASSSAPVTSTPPSSPVATSPAADEGGAPGCPDLPRTFTGDAGPSALPKFPALDTLPKWNGDGVRFADEVVCLLNNHMLGISKAERAALPKRVEGTRQDCLDEHFVQAGLGFCISKNAFLIDSEVIEATFAKTGQTHVMMAVITIMTFYWGWREQTPGNPLGSNRSHVCARGRIVGGLVKDGVIPDGYQQVFGEKESEQPYSSASKTGNC